MAIAFTNSLPSYNCYSSWHRRDDIIGETELSAINYKSYTPPSAAQDGFYCPSSKGFLFHTTPLSEHEAGWFQVDLKGFYTLKCVRVSIRSITEYYLSLFKDVEFRFGNETMAGDISLNPIIGFSSGHIEGRVVEHCVKYPLVGRYLSIKEIGNFTDLVFGEIQVIVQ